ncbi:hypothetical protein [Streptomyces sp. NPDC006334]|uniref:hypothetical protein n=1 Tax=Streptomyces sp. NPDC006334 TaxID=3156754 RepID=UPI0033B2B970
MYDVSTRKRALALVAQGRSLNSVSREWALLGLYLGDGCISAHPRGGYHLRIACADAWPGLIQQCREAIVKVGPAVGVYAFYPRYFFTNVSDDIRRLYTDTLDKLGVEWTQCTRNGDPLNISVARKASVALLDAHVGPKH